MDIWVNVETAHECNLLQTIAISKGLRWSYGEKITPITEMYSNRTCIRISPNKSMLYSDIESCRYSPDRVLIPFPEGIEILQDMFERK